MQSGVVQCYIILEIEEEHYLKIEPDVGEQTLSLNKIALTNR